MHGRSPPSAMNCIFGDCLLDPTNGHEEVSRLDAK